MFFAPNENLFCSLGYNYNVFLCLGCEQMKGHILRSPEQVKASLQRDIHLTATGNCGDAFLSHDGEKVVFVKGWGEELESIWIMDSDGKNQKQLTELTEAEGSPKLSPDDKKIVYAKYSRKKDRFDAWIMNTDGENKHPLGIEIGAVNGANFSWHPSGEKIVFDISNEISGKIKIFDLRKENTILMLAPKNVQGVYQPSWSPNGAKIAYCVLEGKLVQKILTIIDTSGLQILRTRNITN
jgi:Tol biopolymer transport system component